MGPHQEQVRQKKKIFSHKNRMKEIRVYFTSSSLDTIHDFQCKAKQQEESVNMYVW